MRSRSISLGALLLSTLPAAVTPFPIKGTKIGVRQSWRLLTRRFNSAANIMTDTTTSNDPLQGLPQPLILGSASFTRKLILREMGINFAIIVRPIDEGALGSRETDTPEELVRTLSHAKMDHLVSEIEAGRCNDDLPARTEDGKQDWIILTADQVVTCNGKILEKPVDVHQAKQFVAQYGRYPCSTVGNVVLTHWPSRISVSGLHVATIHFSPTLTEAAASRLVDDLLKDNAPVLSCAGGLMVEHPLTRQYIDRMEGSEDSVMGLDKQTVANLLDQLRRQLANPTELPIVDAVTAPE
jgi:septum formation protein